MKIKIRWRIDTEQTFTTDDAEFVVANWSEAIDLVRQIEGVANTVLSIVNLDVD